MDEYVIYDYLKNAYRALNKPFYVPVTEDLIIHMVGKFGLELLLNTKLIEPTGYLGQYHLCCEPKGETL